MHVEEESGLFEGKGRLKLGGFQGGRIDGKGRLLGVECEEQLVRIGDAGWK